MIVTEAQAAKMWCPQTQVSGTAEAMLTNRGLNIVEGMEPKPLLSGCIGPRCMWWRPTLFNRLTKRGSCGAAS